VTGAARGVGAAIAKAFARASAEVVMSARSVDALVAVADAIRAEGGAAEAIPANLGTREACRELARKAGRIDVLVNNAAWTDMRYGNVLDIADEEWDAHWAVSFLAPLTLMKELGRGMVERKHGVVLNISSTASLLAVPHLSTYSVVKSALDSLSRAAGMELAGDGIRVNSVVLGHVDTETLRANVSEGQDAQDVARRNAPIGRLITPGEIADFCVYLASDSAAPITGAVIPVDGGMTAGMYSFRQSFGNIAK
jgi:NAD(P)-dependent dehydrogenase (short-subunit alcohol dehydrogenase family)